jgi:2-C-methyl-D-erythritol 4-phosphate cytidylyltransferase
VSQGARVSALIVAAGQSARMGGLDKIFAPLAGVPLLARTVEAFLRSPSIDRIVVVLRPGLLEAGRALSREHAWPDRIRFCEGGDRRQDSVRLGLQEVLGEGWVLIHDGARPLVTAALIRRGLEAAGPTGAAVPVLPLPDTVKLISDTGLVERTLPRERLRAVQTPQVFRLALIREAHQRVSGSAQHFTDDAAVLEALGHPVAVFPGDPDNIKITTAQDLAEAEQLWGKRNLPDE